MIEAIRGAIAEAVRERRNPLASFVSLMRSLLLKALWKIVPRLPVPVQDRERFVSESMASAFETRIGGKTLSRRLWIAADSLMQNLGRTLAEGVRSGARIDKLVGEMQTAIDKAAGIAGKVEFDVSKDWLARLNATSRGLIADPAGRAKWSRTIAQARKLTESIRDAKSKRKALESLRKIEEAVKAANQELLDAAINEHLVNKQARYLLRIARTERQIANIRAVGDAMAKDRSVIGFRWKLNALHPEPDICDRLANVEFGLGRGVFPKGSCPRSVGHPNCLCTIIPVTRPASERGTVPPDSIKSQLPSGFYGSA